MKQLRFKFFAFAVLLSLAVQAQTTVKAHIINEWGESIEIVLGTGEWA